MFYLTARGFITVSIIGSSNIRKNCIPHKEEVSKNAYTYFVLVYCDWEKEASKLIWKNICYYLLEVLMYLWFCVSLYSSIKSCTVVFWSCAFLHAQCFVFKIQINWCLLLKPFPFVMVRIICWADRVANRSEVFPVILTKVSTITGMSVAFNLLQLYVTDNQQPPSCM